jgi:DNA helicase IV
VLGIEDDLLDATSADQLALIGDGALMAAVGRAKSEHMRDIVQTIQREQDEIIRAPDRGILLVTGGPGTGKTAVALHRVAYLLYESRERYMRGGVLIVGPTPRFMAYVGRVLPSLGEDSTLLRSLGEFVPGVEVDSIDDSQVAAIKGSLDMLRFLDRAIASLIQAPSEGVRLRYEGVDLFADHEALDRIKVRLLKTRKPYNELVVAAHNELARILLDDDDQTAIAGLMDERRFERLASEWWPQAEAISVFRALASGTLASLEELGTRIFTAKQIHALQASWQNGRISQNDVALIDELTTRLGRAPETASDEEPNDDYAEVTTFADRTARRRRSIAELDPGNFAHVVVDEAQDMSPMQWRMVWRRGEAATWTVVGDWAQSASADPSGSRRTLDRLVGGRVFTEKHLDTNYRGAREIAELGDRVLKRIDPKAQPPRSVRASGHIPQLIDRTDDVYKAAMDATIRIGRMVEGTTAVIVPIGRLEEATRALEGTGAQIISSIEAKGLEFDGAVVVNPTEMAEEHLAGLRLLYVAITRAAHVLTIVSAYDETDLFPTLVSASQVAGSG